MKQNRIMKILPLNRATTIDGLLSNSIFSI